MLTFAYRRITRVVIVTKAVVVYGVCTLLAIAYGCGLRAAAEETVSGTPAKEQKDMDVPVFELPVPSDEVGQRYLGVFGLESFKISEIEAQVVIIEIFNMYCPHCQKEAPQVNELYQMLRGNPELDSKIKLIGIAMGNTPFEVDLFREKYSIVFPLFPDQDMTIGKALGVQGTPTFVGLRINTAGNYRIFYSESGYLGGVSDFLGKMLSLSGLEKEIQ